MVPNISKSSTNTELKPISRRSLLDCTVFWNKLPTNCWYSPFVAPNFISFKGGY